MASYTNRNISINEMKKEALTARKRSKENISRKCYEKNFSDIFTDTNSEEGGFDKSPMFLKHNVNYAEVIENEIRISETEVYNSSYILLKEDMQPKQYVKQVVPKVIEDKINVLFVLPKYQRMGMILNLYLTGNFTIYEICDFFKVPRNQKTSIREALKKAKKMVLEALTEEELSKCYWWLRIDKPVSPIPTDPYLKLDYDIKYGRKAIDTSSYTKACSNGEVRIGKLINNEIVWND